MSFANITSKNTTHIRFVQQRGGMTALVALVPQIPATKSHPSFPVLPRQVCAMSSSAIPPTARRRGSRFADDALENASLAVSIAISVAPCIPVPILGPILSSVKLIIDTIKVRRDSRGLRSNIQDHHRKSKATRTTLSSSLHTLQNSHRP